MTSSTEMTHMYDPARKEKKLLIPSDSVEIKFFKKKEGSKKPLNLFSYRHLKIAYYRKTLFYVRLLGDLGLVFGT